RAEQRHDAVAHHLVDGALVPVDRLHHVLEDGIEELARLLGVTVGEQLHRTFQVGKQNRDVLALAFEGGLGGEDALREMFRGVRLRRGKSRCRHWPRRSRRQRCAATIAELAACLYLGATARANRRECCAALPTETGTVTVLCLAPGALHAGASEHSGWRRSE